MTFNLREGESLAEAEIRRLEARLAEQDAILTETARQANDLKQQLNAMTQERDASLVRVQQERYGRYHHVGPNEHCLADCPGCERKGLQERVRFTESFETKLLQIEAAEAKVRELQAQLDAKRVSRCLLWCQK